MIEDFRVHSKEFEPNGIYITSTLRDLPKYDAIYMKSKLARKEIRRNTHH